MSIIVSMRRRGVDLAKDTMNRVRLACILTAFSLLGCGATTTQNGATVDVNDAATADLADDVTADVAGAETAGTDAFSVSVERGPKAIPVDGDPNGLVWADDVQTLFIADDDNNRILTWTDKGGFGQPIALPTAPTSGPGLGGLARLKDGTLVAPRFGMGMDGAMLFVKPDGTPGIVPGLDTMRRRLGVAIDDAGTIYDTFFTKDGTGAQTGSVATVDLAGTEVQVATAGLVKPVGIAILSGRLYISDQGTEKVWRCTPPNCATLEHVADVVTPDLMTPGPNGSLFVGSHAGTVIGLQPDGTSSVAATGLQQPHGVAYDAANKRLFVSDHDPNDANNFLQIFPVN